jgi:hypothetical protein
MFNPYNIVPIIDPEFDEVIQKAVGFDPVAEERSQDWNTDGNAEPLQRWHDRAYRY